MSCPQNPLGRCPAAGSIRQALNRAVKVVQADLQVRLDSTFSGVNCSALRGEWEERKTQIIRQIAGCGIRRRLRTSSALKSCSRFFDAPCRPCDRSSSARAQEEWLMKMTAPAEPVPKEQLELIKGNVRNILGSNWAQTVKRRRGQTRIPDQQGCLEEIRSHGGTFAVSRDEEVCRASCVRVGVAKTKGKHRVVTMQSAWTKRVLRPVHECLYDYISSKDWCVRGNVTKGDFLAILKDRRPGEKLISGDYAAATDNLHLEVVTAVAEVIAESAHLDEDEKRALREAFGSISLYKKVKKSGEIKLLGGLIDACGGRGPT
jgi:hypothetical protein